MGPDTKMQRLSSLLELSSMLASQLELGTLLQTVVDSARGLYRADVSGLLMLAEDDPTRYGGFWVSGWDTPPAHYPTGAGVFNLPITTGRPVRVDHVPSHPRSVGTPPGHPPVGPFLGVPLRFQDQILGTLFVANFAGRPFFTEEDEELLLAFAAHASVAIHNARLYRQVEELAILRERERLAMDLHDTVAQIFFSIGMEAERLREVVPASHRDRLEYLRELASRGAARVRAAIAELHDRGGLPGDANIYRQLAALIEEFKTRSGLEIGLVVTGHVHRVPDPVRDLMCRAAREALTNVAKHAHADMAVVNLAIDSDTVTLTVQDNGVGLRPGAVDPSPGARRFGIATLRRLAERLGGGAEIRSGVEGGCLLRVWASLSPSDGRTGGNGVVPDPGPHRG